MNKVYIVILVLLGAYLAYEELGQVDGRPGVVQEQPAGEWRSGQQVSGQGTVRHILPDDNAGSRHQRFILQLDSGQTLLITHNIDLAPRVSGLRRGDVVRFFGEYEWNDKGGVIHWTHHDPQGRHADGWLEHDGRRYQ